MKYFFALFIFFTFFNSCDTEEKIKISLEFRHFIDEENLELNSLIYSNSFQETYSIQRLLYVVSDIKFHCENGETVSLPKYHFVNLDNLDSSILENISLPSFCTSISFTFGFSGAENSSNLYLNESDNFHNLMFWPDIIGGGYHYLKLEGKYYNSNQEEQFYNTHTGSLNGIDYSFDYEFIINETNFSTVHVDMNINNFYNNPIYSFEEYGSGIMQNEAAQQNIFNNLNDVFSIETN